jgi:hypothetical protein
MTTKSLDNQLQQYWPLLAKEEKQSILTFIKSFVKIKDAPSQRLTIEQYNKELEEAEKRYDAGFITSNEDVLKEAESW